MLLRRGNAGSNTAADHITVIRSALKQLPADNQRGHRSGRSVLIRVDGAGSTHELLDWLTARKLSYSVGFGLPDHTADLLAKIPAAGVDAGAGRRGPGPRRRLGRRAHRAAQPLPVAGRDAGDRPRRAPAPRRAAADHRCRRQPGHRVRDQHPPPAGPAPRSPTWNCGTAAGPAARTASAPRRTPACANLPLHGFDQNRIWCAVVQLACELIAWTQMLGFADHPARRWEPKRLRLRLFATAAALAHHARRARRAPRRRPPLDRPRPGRPRRDHRRARPARLTDRQAPAPRPRNPDRPVDPATPPERGHLVVPPGTITVTPATEPRNDHQHQARRFLRASRSLEFARRIAADMNGALRLEKPEGSPRLRRTIRVPPSAVSSQE